MEFKTGTLVEYRNRPWVVQQSTSADLLRLKPLGGTDSEIMGLYLPLYGEDLKLTSYNFKRPSASDLSQGYQSAARNLYNACRLSFRDVAGPFQSLGRLSFEPRPYQMVPLILALKQEKIRLLISDDVGIGKTLEALLIAKELYDRREIKRFAVVCLPHLCEQWQNEIKDKFGLDAEIIRSSTVSRLEKKLRADQNIFRDIPFQVISIDYVKQKERASIFAEQCPELVIVDEAHTCARPKGANNSQQQRYALLRKLADTDRHLILLTATPHSGQTEEFQSLIGLLDKKFEAFTLDTAQERQELSDYFVQRRRADIKQYLGDEVVFPTRTSIDDDQYKYSPAYLDLLHKVIAYIKAGVKNARSEEKRKQRYIYWDLLALMRGIMSSPDAGISMLQNKISRKENASETNEEDGENRVFIFSDKLKDIDESDDLLPEALEKPSNSDRSKFKEFIRTLESIKEQDDDEKVKQAVRLVEFCLAEGKNPIVFCQYIQTAEYVGKYIAEHLSPKYRKKKVAVETITSRLADEERKLKIDELCRNENHILVCTDCLSEGVNLQQGFEAVIHYDLPWNPNRMEQRNGRIDRFGQTSPEVLVSTISSSNSIVDQNVFRVLYEKQQRIKNQLGVYLPIAENDSSVMEQLLKKIIEDSSEAGPSLFSDEDLGIDTSAEARKLTRLEENEKISHTYFAHNNKKTDPTQLRGVLEEARRVIGGVEDTRDFVVAILENAGVSLKMTDSLSYTFPRQALPANLRHYFKATAKDIVKISFASPTPKGYEYIGRNHILVEDLSRGVVNDTVNGGTLAASRAMVMATDAVQKKTTVMMMRVRSVIRDSKDTFRELVGEEMIFLGYRGRIETGDYLTQEECFDLLMNARASKNLDLPYQQTMFDQSVRWTYSEDFMHAYTDNIALERAQKLVESFSKYRHYINSNTYQVVKPVLPMDVIAVYVFIPNL